jgi:hypothetical protein
MRVKSTPAFSLVLHTWGQELLSMAVSFRVNLVAA